jgi:hypothetical protein
MASNMLTEVAEDDKKAKAQSAAEASSADEEPTAEASSADAPSDKAPTAEASSDMPADDTNSEEKGAEKSGDGVEEIQGKMANLAPESQKKVLQDLLTESKVKEEIEEALRKYSAAERRDILEKLLNDEPVVPAAGGKKRRTRRSQRGRRARSKRRQDA